MLTKNGPCKSSESLFLKPTENKNLKFLTAKPKSSFQFLLKKKKKIKRKGSGKNVIKIYKQKSKERWTSLGTSGREENYAQNSILEEFAKL